MIFLPPGVLQQQVGGGGVFSPSDVSGLLLWLDATDLTTLWIESTRNTQVSSISDKVGAWDDKSGNGNHWIQPSTTYKPTYKENFNTNYPSVWFGGINDRLDGIMSEGANDWTIFAVVESTDTDGYILDFETGRFVFGFNITDFGFYDGAWSTSVTRPDVPTVITMKLDSSNATSGTIDFNRAEVVADDYTQIALGAAQNIGSRYSRDTNYWTGWIASLLIYQGNVSNGDIASIEDFLADQFGITF